VLACVFDATDRVQHMFMRQQQRPGDAQAGAIDVIDEIYVQMDRMLGRLLAQVNFVDPRNMLLVLSDHGFVPFERGVHLNTWLLREGYLALEPGRELPGPYLDRSLELLGRSIHGEAFERALAAQPRDDALAGASPAR